MPEGPEVYVLARVLNSLGFESSSLGKHLILRDAITGELFDFSFGLAGRIAVSNLDITKINHPVLPSGDKIKIQTRKEVEDKLGVDWMTATKEQIHQVVDTWTGRKKQIGSLLLDQREISGIGIAWASEILYHSKIQPELKANLLEFLSLKEALINAIYDTGKDVKSLYLNSVGNDGKKFVNSWFMNLYKTRTDSMKVYKKGTVKKVCGREFYV